MVEPAAVGNSAVPETGAPVMIEVSNLTKLYGLTRAVDNISFTVGKGEILGFLGPNGAGKTTTMRVLTCYTPASAGTARIGGYDVSRQSEQARSILGYLPENAPLYQDMLVDDYLRFMAEVKRYPGSRRRAIVEEAMEECGLTDVRKRIIRNLSKGYRQRVGLAQALLGDPQVLVLDEPTVGLDPRQIAEIRQLIKGMAGRRTVILSTHILPEVSMTCQKVIIINQGRIEAQGTPESLVSALEAANVVMVTVDGPAAAVQELISRVPGVKSVAQERMLGGSTAVYRVEAAPQGDPRPELAQAIIGGGYRLFELQSSGYSLEDIFLRIISRQKEAA
ncbi:MAG TPA: ATP-binding cassette domain-containing protein [Candidatus Sumerlaeota bacterium]|nr:ATP-binding cassette domain-containing protein [Candidatus Sumerlaeota bacterium]HOR29164.1 ATP-binding cassette domain-containing protein [Candidatus Sumerlaeota bacterium]HPK00931.1 ATP-binding cassette domain-containing protein [Candidatus Sumerlaeota bacterium]